MHKQELDLFVEESFLDRSVGVGREVFWQIKDYEIARSLFEEFQVLKLTVLSTTGKEIPLSFHYLMVSILRAVFQFIRGISREYRSEIQRGESVDYLLF